MKEFKTELELFEFYDKFSGQDLSQLYKFLKDKYPNVSTKIKDQKGVVGHLLRELLAELQILILKLIFRV